MKLIFASANKNKIKEIKALLPEHFNLLGLEDIGIYEEIPEPGTTIKENSFLKAKYVLDFLKQANEDCAVFSDDSGLEVDVLNNAPGVYSARYAGASKNDANNNKKLLEDLKLITNRKARFVTVITLIINGEVHYFEGEIKGTISYEARGTNGFGYDPLFIPQGYRSTFAELGAEVKNTISHRALAVKQLINFFATQNL
ncbi:RdgB/HAM1 family non-canonical purine NTP pyrophosphatase [Sediminibacterium sp.]|uniref:RdgB/HAM1 family non-canonical purine NTP pyrophosphatase n=1 Tax=Sediminibacterium sp. TaxID=1917865 RepID=UPI0027325EEA|nr:RdgB/HAM1 family non-canonical purine NTP pyrophosphatase [Sediminibacterium sp.]MDP3567639.1 RdgB/HAM1 family non-canonical purine NTP pyrophosphatase [Sediminibacterium sp.]